MSILVTGSTGTIGAQVLAHLQERGADIRALTRSPGKASLPSGVTPVRGDLADIDSVRAALEGVSTLFLLVPNVADELTEAMLT
ncbi:SDR family oxidoreductase, partial [Acidiphilium sp.]